VDQCVGRSTNAWESPRGCLMYSFTIQMEDGRVVPLVQYVASLAITEAIKDLCTEKVSVLSFICFSMLKSNMLWDIEDICFCVVLV